VSVVWHDLECGGYAQDLPLWRELAQRYGGPVLDIGAGTGRVALDLARHGYEVTALDRDTALIAELRRRAADLPVSAVVADARDFALDATFPLCVVPMQTVQLLGGAAGRTAFLRCVRRHLGDGGVIAAAIVETVECFEVHDGAAAPLPDMVDRDGVVYFSQPTAVRAGPTGFVLERRRERVGSKGQHTIEHDLVELDGLSSDQFEAEGRAAGLQPAGRVQIGSTAEHVGSAVVILHG
jgi:SAM-dependent methyltransferase